MSQLSPPNFHPKLDQLLKGKGGGCSGGTPHPWSHAIKLFYAQSEPYCNKLECLSQVNITSLVYYLWANLTTTQDKLWPVL
jgi:hypothetical protein